MLRSCLLVLCLCLPGTVSAATYARCTKAQIAEAGAAIESARALAVAAGEAVADGPDYARWFGRWDEGRADRVRQSYAAIDRALGAEALHVTCPPVAAEGCTVSIFAWVMPEARLEVNLCPSFFTMPGVRGVVEGSVVFETGTREGTIIHEVSHFVSVAGTGDSCYGRTDCAVMARRDPALAVANADSLQYFAEDVALGQRDD